MKSTYLCHRVTNILCFMNDVILRIKNWKQEYDLDYYRYYAPFLEIFKVWLDGVLSNLIELEMSLVIAGGLN